MKILIRYLIITGWLKSRKIIKTHVKSSQSYSMPSKAKPVFHTQMHMNHRCPHSQKGTKFTQKSCEKTRIPGKSMPCAWHWHAMLERVFAQGGLLSNQATQLLQTVKGSWSCCKNVIQFVLFWIIIDFCYRFQATATSNRLPGPCLQNSSILFVQEEK